MTQLKQASDEMREVEVRRSDGRERHGNCQRCGWPEALHKVRIRRPSGSILDRAEVLVHTSTWMCDECAAELSTVRVPEPVRGTTRQRTPSRTSGDRVVA